MIERKLNVILDLDNTLLCSVEMELIKRYPERFEQLNKKLKYIDMGPFYRIYLRPHLEDFLDFLFKNFNVSVFTAAQREYAKFVVDNIILTSTPGVARKELRRSSASTPGTGSNSLLKNDRRNPGQEPGRLDFIFYSYHNNISLKTYGEMKKLNMLWDMFNMYYFYPSNTIIIDDYDMVKKANPLNCLSIKKFDINLDTSIKNAEEIINDNSLIKVARKLFQLNRNYEKKFDEIPNYGVVANDVKTPILLKDYDINTIF